MARLPSILIVILLCAIGTTAMAQNNPSITSVSRTSGAGGLSVTINGANFGADGTVTFNGTEAKTTTWTANSIVTTVPLDAPAGVGNVVVTVTGKAGVNSPFNVSPSVTNLSFATASKATSVTITGTNFGAVQGASTITFTPALKAPVMPVIVTWGDTAIVASVAQVLTSGSVAVTVAGQTAGLSFGQPLVSLDKYTRGVVGIDLSATSSQATKTNAFLEFNIAGSLNASHTVWLWLNPQIASTPQQASSILSTVTTASPSFNSLLTTQLNQLVESFEVNAGVDYDLWKANINLGDTAMQDTKMVVALTGGVGFQTPLTVSQNNVQEFTVPSGLPQAQLQQIFQGNVPTICPRTPTAGCISTVGFQPADRTHFYKQYWGGLRLKSYYYGQSGGWSKLCSGTGTAPSACDIYPGTVDLTFGQNESVSGGNLHKVLLRTDVYFPLPFNPAFYAFFNAWVHLDRHHENPTESPVILNAAAASPPVDPTQIQYVSIATPDRDYYRVGMGIDLVALISHFKKDQTTTPPPVQPTGAKAAGN